MMRVHDRPHRAARQHRRSGTKLRPHGASIVELLTVIAIIGLVVGLLFPALSGARASSRSLKCQANLRQMAIAATNYAAAWDAFPAAIRYEQRNGELHRIAWDWVTTFSNQVVSPGPLWAFTDNPGEVQQCPDFTGSATFGGDPFTGYNYNTSFIGGEAPFPTTGWVHVRRGVPPHACSRASRCAMFGDGGWKSGANKFMRAPANSENAPWSVIYSGGQAFRHGHSTNIAFIDGHVGASERPRKGRHATDALLQQSMDFPRNGFLSDDDAAYDPR